MLRKAVGTWLAASDSESAAALSFFAKSQALSDELTAKFVVYVVETAGGSSGSPILSRDGSKVLGIHHTQIMAPAFSGKRIGTRSDSLLRDLEQANLQIPAGYGKQVL